MVGLLIITHNKIGEQLLLTAANMLENNPLTSHCLGIKANCNPEKSADQAQRILEELNVGDGILVLTDMYGSTPCNIAMKLTLKDGIAVVAGLNLPMLVRVLNYPDLDLKALTDKALSGGTAGVIYCDISR